MRPARPALGLRAPGGESPPFPTGTPAKGSNWPKMQIVPAEPSMPPPAEPSAPPPQDDPFANATFEYDNMHAEAANWLGQSFRFQLCGKSIGSQGARKALIAAGSLIALLLVIIFVQSGPDDAAAANTAPAQFMGATPPAPPSTSVGAPSEVLLASVHLTSGSFDASFLEGLRADVADAVHVAPAAVSMPIVQGARATSLRPSAPKAHPGHPGHPTPHDATGPSVPRPGSAAVSDSARFAVARACRHGDGKEPCTAAARILLVAELSAHHSGPGRGR